MTTDKIPTQNQPDWTPPQGPFAFPWLAAGHLCVGMELRDWFAGQALAMLADPAVEGKPDEVATYVYSIADALLAARTQEKG